MQNTSATTSPLPANTELEVANRLEELRIKLIENDPNIHGHLKEIHNSLKEHPELVHLLSDSQIQTWFNARKSLAGVAIQAVASKTAKAKASTRVAKLGVNDF